MLVRPGSFRLESVYWFRLILLLASATVAGSLLPADDDPPKTREEERKQDERKAGERPARPAEQVPMSDAVPAEPKGAADEVVPLDKSAAEQLAKDRELLLQAYRDLDDQYSRLRPDREKKAFDGETEGLAGDKLKKPDARNAADPAPLKKTGKKKKSKKLAAGTMDKSTPAELVDRVHRLEEQVFDLQRQMKELHGKKASGDNSLERTARLLEGLARMLRAGEVPEN